MTTATPSKVPLIASDVVSSTRSSLSLECTTTHSSLGLAPLTDAFKSITNVKSVWDKYHSSQTLSSEEKSSIFKELSVTVVQSMQSVSFTATKVIRCFQELKIASSATTSLAERSITFLSTSSSTIGSFFCLHSIYKEVDSIKTLLKERSVECPKTKELALAITSLLSNLTLLVGFIITISATFATLGPALLSAASIFFLVSSLLSLAKNGVEFREWLNDKQAEVGKYDKLIQYFNLFIIGLSMLGFIAANIISGGLPIYVIAVTCLIYAVWIGIGVMTLDHIYEIEKKLLVSK